MRLHIPQMRSIFQHGTRRRRVDCTERCAATSCQVRGISAAWKCFCSRGGCLTLYSGWLNTFPACMDHGIGELVSCCETKPSPTYPAGSRGSRTGRLSLPHMGSSKHWMQDLCKKPGYDDSTHHETSIPVLMPENKSRTPPLKQGRACRKSVWSHLKEHSTCTTSHIFDHEFYLARRHFALQNKTLQACILLHIGCVFPLTKVDTLEPTTYFPQIFSKRTAGPSSGAQLGAKLYEHSNMVVSQNIGTPKKVPLILGNPHMFQDLVSTRPWLWSCMW